MRAQLLLALLLLVSLVCHSQVYRSYTFGSASGQIRNNFNLKTDGNSSVVFIYGNKKFEIKKIDLDGTELYKHTYYVYSDSLFNLCLPVSSYSEFVPHRAYFDPVDSTTYLCGIIYANYMPCFDHYNVLIKFSSIGDTLWILHVGPANENFDFIKFNDSTFIFLNGGMVSYNLLSKSVDWHGSLSHPNTWFANPKVALRNDDTTFFYCGYYRPAPFNLKGEGLFGKMNINGNPIWAKLYNADTSNAYNFNKMCRDLNNKYYMLTEVYDSVNANVLTSVTCLNDTGMVLWSKYYYLPNYQLQPFDIIEKSNGGCLVVCNYLVSLPQAVCPVTINLDSMGNVITAYKQYSMAPTLYGGFPYTIQKASENTYAIDGPKLVIIDSSGWSCDATAITVLDSANYFTVSNIAFQLDSLTFNANNINVFYEINNAPDSIVVDSCMYYVGVNEATNTIPISIYPQPAQDYLYINSSQFYDAIKIMDVAGRTVLQFRWSDKTLAQKVNISLLTSGIYFYSLCINNSQLVKGKFVVIKN